MDSNKSRGNTELGASSIVVANIHAHVLRALAPQLCASVARGGWLGLSGISQAQVSTVVAAFPTMRVEASLTLSACISFCRRTRVL
jgi:ribosomal protein L11 methylase PrmA